MYPPRLRVNVRSPSVALNTSVFPPARRFLDARPPDLQIYAVTPVSDISDMPQLERVPERIKSFYRINNVSRFHYDRPFHKGPKDRDNEFRVDGARPFLPHSSLPPHDSKAGHTAAGSCMFDSCSMFVDSGSRFYPDEMSIWTISITFLDR